MGYIAQTGFRRGDFIADHESQVRMSTDVCKIAGVESHRMGSVFSMK